MLAATLFQQWAFEEVAAVALEASLQMNSYHVPVSQAICPAHVY